MVDDPSFRPSPEELRSAADTMLQAFGLHVIHADDNGETVPRTAARHAELLRIMILHELPYDKACRLAVERWGTDPEQCRRRAEEVVSECYARLASRIQDAGWE
jgi:hypothetical protein